LYYVIPLSESHLKRTLREWMNHYNSGRPHQSIGPGIPDQADKMLPPAGPKSVSPNRIVIAKSILGGLDHWQQWADAA